MGAGFDYAQYGESSIGLTVSLANPGDNTGNADGDTYAAVEGLVGTNFDDILTAGPKVPPSLPQGVTQFATRVMVPIDARGVLLSVAQSYEGTPAVSTSEQAVLLDIDASIYTNLATDASEIWSRLTSLRDVKNMAFFGSLRKLHWERYL